MPVVTVDVETLAVDVAVRRYERLTAHHWRHTDITAGEGAAVEFDVDEYGVVIDQPGRFRRQR